MVLQKDPDGDITLLEELSYQEVFSDINTPGFWKAENEDDLITSKAIILDGHSTILVYNQSNENLPWTAYNELGQYKYSPDNVGDGIVIFSHNFYFEFQISIGNQLVTVESTLDGTGIKAITLPLKDVPIDDLFSIMTKRIEEAVTSEVQSFDDTISITIGKKIVIPESISMKIGMKLSLMGISLTGMKAKDVLEIKSKKEDNVVEQVFDEKSTRMKDMLDDEEKELKKRRGSKSKKKIAPQTNEMPVAARAEARSASSAPPPVTKTPPPTASPGGGGAPPPPVVSSTPPPPPRLGGPSTPPRLGVPSTTPSPPPKTSGSVAPASPLPPAAKPKPAKTAMPMAEPMLAMDEMEAEEADSDEDMYSEAEISFAGSDVVDDVLIAKGMDVTDKPMSLRYTHTSYFSRMLLNRAYPLVVKISIEEVGVRKSITSVASGERITEKEDTLVVSEEDPNVTIKPEFPGCFVVPTEQVVDIRKDKSEVKFHVTPLALGTLDGVVKFVQSGKIIQSMSLETKVITHRISKWLATAGGAASAIPFMLAFALDETVPQFMENRLDRYMPSISEFGGLILGVVTAMFLFASGFVYRLQKPRRSSSSLAFPR